MKVTNKKAYFNYQILDTWTCGIVLQGTEIKSIREGKVNFVDSFAIVNNSEVLIKGLHISEYTYGTYTNHDVIRDRKLLLKRKEIEKIITKVKDQGMTLVPLSMFINARGWCKVELGLCKGKKLYDKRESIKKKDQERDQQREN